MIAGILLAAGRGERFGGAAAGKLVAPFGGEPIVRLAARALLAAPVDRVVVVTGAGAAQVSAALVGLGLERVHNPRHAEGIGTSVATGVGALASQTEAAVIALGDQPFVAAEVLDALVATWRAGRGRIVAPRYAGVRGNPVLFDRCIFPELLALAADVGARVVIEREAARVAFVDVSAAMPAEVDTPDDLRRLRGEEAVAGTPAMNAHGRTASTQQE